MNTILFCLVIISMPLLTFLLANTREKQFSKKTVQGTELDYLYEYKSFLLNIGQVKNELQDALEAMNFDKQTCFTLFDLTILKKEIRNSIEELSASALQKSISINEFHSRANDLHKRINILSHPLAA
ncbi:MAG: hypothetical protein JWP44_373 [Mucilaginibacter sp.]|nr:hypothetical protein [Mucilaginibacter sp.]